MSLIDKIRSSSSKLMSNIVNAEKSYATDTFYVPVKNSDGSASVVLRFLPQADPDKLPFVLRYSHFFKDHNGKWCVINPCPTTIGKQCPCCAKNSEYWNSGSESLKNIARERKRKKEYYANVLVLKDDNSPEKVGTVQIFKFGPAIHKMIMDAIKPQFADDIPLNPFDVFDGANFIFRIAKDKSKGFPTYEQSKFASPSPLYDGDEAKIEAVLEQLHDLDELVKPELFMSEERMNEIVARAYTEGRSSATPVSRPQVGGTIGMASSASMGSSVQEQLKESVASAPNVVIGNSNDAETLKAFEDLVAGI